MNQDLRASHSDRVPRIGLIGGGWIGRIRTEALVRSRRAQVCAIVDPSPQARRDVRQLVGSIEECGSLDELLSLGLDGVVIATPNAFHVKQARKSLERGIAVFCQKPVGGTADETRLAVDTARLSNRLLATDFAYRFTAGMQKIRELVSSGALGRIYSVELCFHNSYGPDKTWYYDPLLSCGGCLVDLGVHLIDLALWTLDFPDVGVTAKRLFVNGEPIVVHAAGLIEDHAIATLDLDGTAVAHIACSWRSPTGGDALIRAVFCGTKGSAEFRNVNGSFYDFRADHYVTRSNRSLAEPPDDWGGRAIISWAEDLAAGGHFNPAAEQLVRIAEVIDMIYD
jgi:predicted dehydrogenase